MNISKILVIILLLLFVNSCVSQNKKENKKMEEENANLPDHTHDSHNTVNFNVRNNIDTILHGANLKLTDNQESDVLTNAGYKKFESTSDRLLIFEGIHLANTDKNGLNRIIFHYGDVDEEIGALSNEKHHIIGAVQINIYSEKDSDSLLNALNKKLGNPLFDTTETHNEATIKNNEMIPSKNDIKTAVYIWKISGITYYFYTKKNLNAATDNISTLFVFNRNHKEWPDLLSSALGFQYVDKI